MKWAHPSGVEFSGFPCSSAERPALHPYAAQERIQISLLLRECVEDFVPVDDRRQLLRRIIAQLDGTHRAFAFRHTCASQGPLQQLGTLVQNGRRE
jgi:hypothetical protein